MKSSDFLEYEVDKEIPLSEDQLRENADLDPALTKKTPLPPEGIFSESYLEEHQAEYLGGGYGIRGDHRTPEEMMEGKIPPKCKSKKYPHYNLTDHLRSSECSGMVSLSDSASTARQFAVMYSWEESLPVNYQYIAFYPAALKKMDEFNWHSREKEVTATTPPIIKAFRKCEKVNVKENKSPYLCHNIFVHRAISEELTNPMISGLLTPFEKAQGVQVKLKK